MYEIKKGKVLRGVDTISNNVLVTQLNNIETMMSKHRVAELSAQMRVLADWFDMQDTSSGLLNDDVQKDLHKVANLLSAINKEVCV